MKQTVHYIGNAIFTEFGGFEQANVLAIDHPLLGLERVTTSAILEKFEDGSFETRNSIYVQLKEERNQMKNTNWVYFTFSCVSLAAEYRAYSDGEVEIIKIQPADSNEDISDVVSEMIFEKAREAAENQEREFDESRKESALEGRYAE